MRFGHSQVGTKSVRGHCCFNGCVRIPLLQNQEGKAFKPSGELSILKVLPHRKVLLCLAGTAARKEVSELRAESGKMCLKAAFIVILGITYFS